eukprot:3107014-Rhodomonas_salina.2
MHDPRQHKKLHHQFRASQSECGGLKRGVLPNSCDQDANPDTNHHRKPEPEQQPAATITILVPFDR